MIFSGNAITQINEPLQLIESKAKKFVSERLENIIAGCGCLGIIGAAVLFLIWGIKSCSSD